MHFLWELWNSIFPLVKAGFPVLLKSSMFVRKCPELSNSNFRAFLLRNFHSQDFDSQTGNSSFNTNREFYIYFSIYKLQLPNNSKTVAGGKRKAEEGEGQEVKRRRQDATEKDGGKESSEDVTGVGNSTGASTTSDVANTRHR